MWDNNAEPGRSHMTPWLMRTACWILKAKNIHTQYVISTKIPPQQMLHNAPQYYIIRIFSLLSIFRLQTKDGTILTS
jgi:hypothetical protein